VVCKKAQAFAAMKLAYLKVETFEDLLARNLDYLSGALDFNPYTHSRIADDADMLALVPKLKAVTELGFYSITGQPGKIAYNVFDPKKKLYVTVQQRNYTSGWLEESAAEGLEAWLKSSRHKNSVYYRIDFDNEAKGYLVQQNMPYNAKNGFNLSRYHETLASHEAALPDLAKDPHLWNERVNVWNDVLHRRNVFYQYKDFPKVMKLFLSCAGVYLVARNYGSGEGAVSVEDVLAEYLQQRREAAAAAAGAGAAGSAGGV